MKHIRYIVAGTMSAFVLMLLVCFVAQAKEVRYPVPCYEGEELAKVRAWEKTWVGKKITVDNIDGVKDFIPESYYSVFINPDWGGDYWFNIVPYKQVKPTPGDISLTRKYAGTCSIDEQDALQNYVAGTPFTHPKTGQEVMYNFDMRNWGDQYEALQDMYLIDGKRRYDRKMVLNGNMLIFSGRRDIPPVPELPNNTKGIYWGMHSEYYEPASYKGTRALSLTWEDRSRDWASWSFSSATRRIMRRSMAQRQTPQGGSDAIADDGSGWNWAIKVLNCKLLGRKELLCPRHADREKMIPGHREGYCLFNDVDRERINTYMVEAVHKDPDYIYGKQVFYVDPETWWILYADKWDKRGKMWKGYDNLMEMYFSRYKGVEVPCAMMPLVIDLERMHSTAVRCVADFGKTGGREQDQKYFEPRALLKYGY